MKTIAFHNLGCKVNSYELDVMQQIMQERGYEIVPFDQKADVYVINTCTVTNIADRKSRQMLHRAKQKNPDAVVVAVGCYVQTDLAGAVADPAVDLAVGNNRKKDLAEILEKFLAERGDPEHKGQMPEDALAAPDKTLGGTTVPDIAKEKEYEEMTLKTTAEHTRAYVKIQDGCNQFCSYCAIPLARGRVRSRKPEDVLREIRGIAAAGYQEIVLTGIHVSSYGIDLEQPAKESAKPKAEGASPETESAKPEAEGARPEAGSAGANGPARDYRGESKLLDLIERIHEIPELKRIRVSSLEPRIVTKEAAERLAALPKVCPHFHLSLQSGCDATLKRMNRHYTAQQYLESVRALRDAYAPRVPAITTDVIAGFPGETEEEFAQTKAFLEQVGFYEMHVFKYSKRAGTRAAVMEGQVPEPVKAQRSDVLLELEREQSVAFRKQKLGRIAEVLLEEEKKIAGRAYFLGHTADYVRVAIPADACAAEAIRATLAGSKIAASDSRVSGEIAASDGKTSGEIAASDGREAAAEPRHGFMVRAALKEFLTEDILLGDETDLF